LAKPSDKRQISQNLILLRSGGTDAAVPLPFLAFFLRDSKPRYYIKVERVAKNGV
jgi:hypothetical protein